MNKPIILLAFANNRDDTVGYLRNLPDEARWVRDVLSSAEQAGLCEVEVRSNCTASDVFQVFQDPRFRNRIAIFHYGGHANGYQLLLESSEGQAAAADAGGLAAFLAQQQGLQLVFLNGCSTQQQTRGLLDANVSAVISTSRAIDDQVATDFARQFYQGLAGGATIRTAYNEAEAAVQMAKGGKTRALYYGGPDDSRSQQVDDRWPWNLDLREGSEKAAQWNLPEAVNDPLFGLPPLPEQDLPESPYRHLNWFTRKDAEVFFGRGHQIRELYDRLTAPRTAPIILFYGQSGVGKSSILAAGLLPRLERDHEVRYLRRTQGGLLDTLQLAFLPEASDVPIEKAWRAKEKRAGKPLIVFLDQVEEVYTRTIADLPDELEQLLLVVKAAFGDPSRRPQGKLVLGFRKEWLAELETQLVDYKLPQTKVYLEPLDRRGIIEVVSGPARSEPLRDRYGLTVEDGLGEIIADFLMEDRGSAIAPTLQILLTKMWSKATEANYDHPHFSLGLYQHLKRDGILLTDFLDQQIAAFRQRYPKATDSGLLLDILALHTTPLGTADQCSVEQLQEQYAHVGDTLPALLQHCQDLYLLTVVTRPLKDSPRTTRLAHDTLAPLVRKRFDESDKPGQRARGILENRTRSWLTAKDLALVKKGTAGMRCLTDEENAVLVRSRRRRLAGRLAWVFAATVAILLITVAGYFSIQTRIKNAEAAVAEQQRIAQQLAAHAQAEFARSGQPQFLERSALLSIESLRRQSSLQAELTLRSAMARLPREVLRRKLPDGVLHVTFSPSGRYLGVGGSRNLRVIATTDWHDVIQEEIAYNLDAIAFSRDSRYVAVAHQFGTRIYSLETGEPPRDLKTMAIARKLAFHPVQDWLASWPGAVVDRENRLAAVTVQDVDTEHVVNGDEHTHDWRVGNLAFSQDGTFLASCGGDRRIIVSDTDAWKVIDEFELSDTIWDVSFSPKQKFIGAAVRDGHVLVRDFENRETIRDWRHSGVFAVAWSPDGMTLASAGDRTCSLWDVETDREKVRLMHAAEVSKVRFAPNNEWVATASEDFTARVWDSRDGSELVRVVHEKEVYDIAISPDCKRLATASLDNFVRVVDASRFGEKMRLPLDLSPCDISLMCAGPLGKHVAVTDGDHEKPHRAYLVDTDTGTVAVVDLPSMAVKMSFGQKGDLLAIGCSGGDVAVASPSRAKAPRFLSTPESRFVQKSCKVLVLSASAKLLCAGFQNDHTYLWDLDSREPPLLLQDTQHSSDADFHPDESLVAVAGKQGIQLVSTEDTTKRQTLSLDDNVNHLRFSSDGQWLCASGGIAETGFLRIWKISDAPMEQEGQPKPIHDLPVMGPVQAMSLSPDGRYAITVSDTTNLVTDSGLGQVWDIRDGREVFRFSAREPGLLPSSPGSTPGILCFESDRQLMGNTAKEHYFAVFGYSSDLRIWSVEAQREIGRICHLEQVTDAALIGNQRFVVSLAGQTLQVSLLGQEDLVAEACSRLTRDLSREEWRDYVGAEPYRTTRDFDSKPVLPRQDVDLN